MGQLSAQREAYAALQDGYDGLAIRRRGTAAAGIAGIALCDGNHRVAVR